MERKLTKDNYLTMDREKLLGYWLVANTGDDGVLSSPVEAHKIVAEFEARGVAKVAELLEASSFTVPDVEMHNVSLVEAQQHLLHRRKVGDCRIFRVVYRKRETGEVRHMKCRYGALETLVDKDKKFEDKEYNLSTVWDTDAEPKYTKTEQSMLDLGQMKPKPKGGYRSVALEGLISVDFDSVIYVVIP